LAIISWKLSKESWYPVSSRHGSADFEEQTTLAGGDIKRDQGQKIQFVGATGTTKSQSTVMGTGTAYHEQAQRIGNRHNVSGTGTAYHKQA